MAHTFADLLDRARALVCAPSPTTPAPQPSPGASPTAASRISPTAVAGRAVLGIAGAPGAGKTTLAEELVKALASSPPPGMSADWVAHVPMDGFHLSDAALDRLGRRDRKGAPDTFDSWGYAALLRRLLDDRDEMIYAPGFERVLEQPIAAVIGIPREARLIVTEGNYLLLDTPQWRPVRALLSESWYADLAPTVRLHRLIARHIRFGKPPATAQAWATGTDEHNARLIATTRPHADVIIPSEVLLTLGTPPD
ncbi:nucleoside/nucleotide kinase family protein [Actinoplanes sp. NPDC051851]|uniref:nucleoside/nucleotide kinase family protein n=1 Tax=Actinoplanes sp. NPDC051851 TaxID=3154753 RepID=UPI00342D7EFD